MNVLIGLGNPGSQYAKTRHNAGWMFLDVLATELGAVWTQKTKFHAEVASTGDIMLLKPQTFMNESGRTVRAVWDFYHSRLETTDQIWVIHDDLDLPLGTWKLQLGTGPKAHNGVLSVDAHLGTQQYWHVRLGVDARTPEIRAAVQPAEYVLMPFPSGEREVFATEVEQAKNALIEKLGLR